MSGLGVGSVCSEFFSGPPPPPHKREAMLMALVAQQQQGDVSAPPPSSRLLVEALPFKPPELKSTPSSQALFDDSSKRLMLSSTSLNPPSPMYEDEFSQNSPTFFVDAYTKVRNLSSELFQCASDALARGYSSDPSKVEYLATELLRLSRQLNNSGLDEGRNQDSKILPPPLVRPRRIRRKHNEEEEVEDGEKKRKLGTGSELYCHSCGTTDTPEWRRGPDGCKSLCNACGLHYAKILRRETMIPNRQPGRTTMGVNSLLN